MTSYAEKMNPREKRKITKFGDPTIIMGGKKKNLRRMIEENARDTGIYEQIDKYGLNPIQEIPIEEAIQDFTEVAGDLRSSLERGMLAKQKWKELPREIRKEFDNDINTFMKNGFDWMQTQQEKITEENNRKTEEFKKAIMMAGDTGDKNE